MAVNTTATHTIRHIFIVSVCVSECGRFLWDCLGKPRTGCAMPAQQSSWRRRPQKDSTVSPCTRATIRICCRRSVASSVQLAFSPPVIIPLGTSPRKQCFALSTYFLFGNVQLRQALLSITLEILLIPQSRVPLGYFCERYVYVTVQTFTTHNKKSYQILSFVVSR